MGNMKMTTQSCKSGTTTLPRTNVSGHAEHATIYLDAYYCVMIVGLTGLALDLVVSWLRRR